MKRVDHSALKKVLAIGDQKYAKSVLDKFAFESYTYIKDLESLLAQGKTDEISKLASKFARTSKILGGIEIGELCAQIIGSNENKCLSVSEIRLLSEAKDYLISRLTEMTNEQPSCDSLA